MFEVVDEEGLLGRLERNGINKVVVGPKSMADILIALGQQQLCFEDGWIRGQFTVAKNGQEIRLVPWLGEAARSAAEDLEGVPDISAHLLSMAPQTAG